MKKSLILSLVGIMISAQSLAADFTIQVSPANNSVSDVQVSSISSSKITGQFDKSRIDNLGSLAAKSTITNSEVADSALSINKIANFASEVANAIASSMSNYLLKSDIKAPQVDVYTSGSGTYTLPSGAKYLRLRMVGGGGGGAGSSNASNDGGNGSDGSASTFGSSLHSANGGGGAFHGGGANGTAGGSYTIGAGATGIGIVGTQGGASPYTSVNVAYVPSGYGGGSALFGGGGGSTGAGNSGQSGAANTGGGGSGGGIIGGGGSTAAGAGGGGGGSLDIIIASPAANYSYVVGNGGSAGGGGSGNGLSGAAGAKGLVEVTAYFQ
jgi:hypothetical protein